MNKCESIQLFQWAYENSTSDKLEIIRHIVSLQLSQNPLDNYALLQGHVKQILETAKGNFKYLIRKNVELFFEKRLKLSEFIQKYNESIGENISTITNELVNNLYRTIGIILGVILAALINPNPLRTIVFWTSTLYLAYVVFIMVYIMPHIYIKFRSEVETYLNNIKVLKGVLLEDEITQVEGDSFKKNRYRFLLYFGLTNLGYGLLGCLAICLLESTK